MDTFKNIKTGEIVTANTFSELFAFSHNSNYELYELEEKPIIDDKTPKSNNKKGKKSKDETSEDTNIKVNDPDESEKGTGENEETDEVYTREELIEALTLLNLTFDDNATDEELKQMLIDADKSEE